MFCKQSNINDQDVYFCRCSHKTQHTYIVINNTHHESCRRLAIFCLLWFDSGKFINIVRHTTYYFTGILAIIMLNNEVAPMIQYIPRNMHTVFALLCFVVVIHWPIFPHPSGLLHWHCGNLTIAPVPAKQPWWIWINTSCEFIMNDCITTTKQSTTKPCAYFLGYTVWNKEGGMM